MFFVIDKSKIYSYLVAISTVTILFVAATGINSLKSSKDIVPTSSNVVDENIITNNLSKENNLVK